MDKLRNFIKNHGWLAYFAEKSLGIHDKIRLIKRRLFRLIDKEVDKQNLMVNLGGGRYARRHWRVLDFPSQHYSSNNGFIDYCHDLTSEEPLPFSDGSVSFFFSLEHIPQENCQRIFDEMYRCLKQDGSVRIAVPDFDLAHDALGKNDIGYFAKFGSNGGIEKGFLDHFATFMMDKTSPEELRRNYARMTKEKLGDFYTQRIPRESQRKSAGNHINWWTFEKLKRMLIEAGFRKIYRSTAQGSRFSELRGTGRNSGFDSTHPEISLFVEAIK